MENDKKTQFLEWIDENIATYGYHKMYILEEKGFTPFGYSVGLYKNFGIPEVFVSGLPNGLTNTLITNYATIFKEKQIPLYEKLDYLIDRFKVYLIPVDSSALKDKVLASYRLYEDENFKSIQIIYPDLNGYFPEEKNFDYDMEIFGHLKNQKIKSLNYKFKNSLK